jgi:O-antigen ligase
MRETSKIQAIVLSAIPYGLIIFVFMMFAMPTSKLANIGFYLFVALPVLFSMPILINDSKFKSAILIFTSLLSFWVFLSMLGEEISDTSKLGKEIRHACYVLVFAIAAYYSLSTKVVSVKQFIFYVLCLSIIYTFVAMFYQYGWNEHLLVTRLFPPLRLDSPIFVSLLLVCFGVAMMNVYVIEKQYIKTIVLLLLLLFFLYFYNSRAGIVALCSGVIVMLVMSHAKFRWWAVLGLFIIMITYLFGLYFYGNLLDRGGSYRIDIWLSSLDKVVECGVFFGCGFSESGGVVIESGKIFQHPHNIYLMHLLNFGLLGLISLLTLLYWLVIKGFKSQSVMVFGLVTSLIGLIFDGKDLLTNPNELWLLFWLPVVLVYWEIKQNNKKIINKV